MKEITQTDIRKTLDQALLGLLPFLGLSVDDIAWRNAGFKPKAKKGYLRVTLIPGETRAVTLGDLKYLRLVGVYQISVAGVKDSGMAWSDNVINSILPLYRTGRKFDCCGSPLIISASYEGAGISDGDREITPLTIAYYCHTIQNQSRDTA